MNHKYSTMAIFLLIGVSTIILVSGLDGSGTAGYIPVYFSPDRLINSILFINGSSVSINGSEVCTSSNNLCNNSITNNITNNITYNITNNFTVNDTRFVVNFTVVDDTTVTHTICLFNNTCFSTAFIDSTGGGGFSSDQAVNTTSNVTFDNIIVTNNITTDYLKITGYSTTPSIFADNDANTGLMFDGPDILSLHTGGIQAILVNSLQYTGLGMTPNQRLTVNGSGNFTENVTATNFRGNLNWSFLQNIPTYIIDYMPFIASVQTNITNLNNSLTTRDNNLQSNITILISNNVSLTLSNITLNGRVDSIVTNLSNVNASLMNEISLQSANNITQSGQIDSINTKLTSAITNYTADNTTQAQELSALRTSNISLYGQTSNLQTNITNLNTSLTSQIILKVENNSNVIFNNGRIQNLSIGENITGDLGFRLNRSGLYLSANYSTQTNPVRLEITNYSTGNSIAYMFDNANGLYNSYSGTTQLYGFHSIIIKGDTNAIALPTHRTDSDASLIVLGTQTVTNITKIVGVASQVGDYLQVVTSGGSHILNITANGNMNLRENLTVSQNINASDGSLGGSGICTASNGRCSSSVPSSASFGNVNVTTLFIGQAGNRGNLTISSTGINIVELNKSTIPIMTKTDGYINFKNYTKRHYNTSNNTVYLTLSDLNITLPSYTNYSLFCNLVTSSAVATTGEQIRFNVTGGALFNITYDTAVSATARTPFQGSGWGAVQGSLLADTGSGGTLVQDTSFIAGIIETNINSSLISYHLLSEIVSSQVIVHRGSWCEYSVIQ